MTLMLSAVKLCSSLYRIGFASIKVISGIFICVMRRNADIQIDKVL